MNNGNGIQQVTSQSFQEENTPSNTVIQQEQFPHKPPRKNVLILLSVLLGFLIFGLVSYYLGMQLESTNKKNQQATNTPILTSAPNFQQATPVSQAVDINDWPVYKSSTYGFSFHYRPDLKVKEGEKSISLFYDGELNPHDLLFDTDMYVNDNPFNYSPEEYAKKELCKNALKNPDRNIDNKDYCTELVTDNLEPYINNRIQGIKTKYNLFESPMYTIVFPYQENMIVIASTGETGSDPTELGKQTIDKILSTFSY
ncbi:MAG: hypothetical protein ACOX6V_00165 [Patescibacteria group bacterium]|jgi:hypothetical protein